MGNIIPNQPAFAGQFANARHRVSSWIFGEYVPGKWAQIVGAGPFVNLRDWKSLAFGLDKRHKVRCGGATDFPNLR
jgi:hypothetical protein